TAGAAPPAAVSAPTEENPAEHQGSDVETAAPPTAVAAAEPAPVVVPAGVTLSELLRRGHQGLGLGDLVQRLLRTLLGQLTGLLGQPGGLGETGAGLGTHPAPPGGDEVGERAD